MALIRQHCPAHLVDLPHADRETDMDNDFSELNADDLAMASGGMKWDHNYQSKNVVDARGGYFTILGETITYDLNGKVTSVSQT
jgi:hypothetical protein